MIYFLGILVNFAVGFLIIRLLTAGRLNLILHILLSFVLGFGIDGVAAFYTHILLNQFNRWLPIGLVVLAIPLLYFVKYYPLPKFKMTKDYGLGMIALGILFIPLAISAHYYPLGGWDAWSCWSLKAKFIFLGKENWKDVLSPGLWRSNTNYPILWPLINVWFWDLGGKFDQTIPMLNSVFIALLTAGILLFGLLELTGMLWASLSITALLTALPINVTLYTSQYSDSLLGLFLLSGFMSLLLAEKFNLPKLKLLCMVFLGLMSFTKNEGLILAGVTFLLVLWHFRSGKKELMPLLLVFLIAALPTIIFTLFMAPKNEAFINGLASTEKPTNLARLTVILVYPWFEFISGKWNGFWLLVLGGMMLGHKRLCQSTLGLMGLSMGLYLAVVMGYYAVNTFFEIGWWLSTTLSRILFALIPTIALWVGLASLSSPLTGEKKVK